MKDRLGSISIAVIWLLIAGFVAIAFYAMERKGYGLKFNEPVGIGHITRAFGTVKRVLASDPVASWNRVETGRSVLVPLQLGDQIQTGEDSAAEVLFYGGSILQLEAGAVVRFEDEGDQIGVRLLMGKGYFQFPAEAMGESQFMFQKPDGSRAEVPSGKKMILTLSSVQRLEDAVDVQVLDEDEKFDSLEEIELGYLANHNEVANQRLLIVPPIEDENRIPAAARHPERKIPAPQPRFPANDDELGITEAGLLHFNWQPLPEQQTDPVVAYEVEVRPAFGYDVEDRARKIRIFKKDGVKFPIEKVGGTGVFLWSVRAVTASGARGPASQNRWLELKFPKQLMAPELDAPKVE